MWYVMRNPEIGTLMEMIFEVGQCVEYVPAGTVGGRYTIVKMLPSEYHQSEPRYQIRGELTGQERVVGQSTLNDQVGSNADYEEMEAARTAHFKKAGSPKA